MLVVMSLRVHVVVEPLHVHARRDDLLHGHAHRVSLLMVMLIVVSLFMFMLS